MVCDAHYKVTSLVTSWPGTTHDSRVFRQSILCQQFEAGKSYSLANLGEDSMLYIF